MALRPTTIRFAPDALDLVEEAAQRSGVTVSQFVREAATMRAVLMLGHGTELEELAERVRNLSRRED